LLPDQTDQQIGFCLPVAKQTFLFGDLLIFPVRRRTGLARRAGGATLSVIATA